MEDFDFQVLEKAIVRVRSFLTIELPALLNKDISLLDAVDITFNCLLEENSMAVRGEILEPDQYFDEVFNSVAAVRVELYDLLIADKDLFSQHPFIRVVIGQRIFVAALEVIVRDVLAGITD